VARRAASAFDWFGPDAADERVRLSAWCESVGPAVVRAPARTVPLTDVSLNGLVVATWNVHEGGGDIQRLLAKLRRRSSESSDVVPELVLLVQEAFRGSDEVPLQVPPTVRPPGPIHPKRAAISDIVSIADHEGMWLAYVPSMRNGRDKREDRGSAILSTLPLSDVGGIELPWISQRRVAVMATINARQSGAPWRVRAISVHLDNRPGRATQAAALAQLASAYKGEEPPIIIGGDLNTWAGPSEDAVRRIDEVVARVVECGDAPTFRLRRHLDYLFTTLPPGVRHGCRIDADTFGSDHHPTVLRLFGSGEVQRATSAGTQRFATPGRATQRDWKVRRRGRRRTTSPRRRAADR
jgi:endonuclease/exonuclease/phosphatase family metal-dependent hydrolase